MKLADVIIFSLAVAFLIMGIHQIMTVGFGTAYWMFMVVMILFFIYSYRKKKEEQ